MQHLPFSLFLLLIAALTDKTKIRNVLLCLKVYTAATNDKTLGTELLDEFRILIVITRLIFYLLIRVLFK
jgi:hypothetical protein